MSRRPDNKAAQNQQTIKSLLKLESNKICADCKKNKHPRWASWNLGIFICIRCSGIHRGMGTHISRVKSVDLDAWNDEQLQSVLRWGNGRANKYWEAKLAPGHVPSDAKIENFIRTKYESKRWVMDGPIPDPSTLDDGGGGDENVPLSVVREKAQLDRSAQQGPSTASARSPLPGPRGPATESFDLIGGDDLTSQPPRPSTTNSPGAASRAAPPPRQSTPSQLLGGLDFLGNAPQRPTSAGQNPATTSRPDLKQSILSLYASAPKPQPQSPPVQSSHASQSSFGGLGSPATGSTSAFGGMGSPPASNSAFGGMNDAFAGLSFDSSSSAPPKPAPTQQPASMSAFDAFSQLSPSAKANPAPPQMTSPPISGGGFFDAGPKPPPKPTSHKPMPAPSLAVRKVSNASDGFGDFSSGISPAPAATSTGNQGSNKSGLLDFTQTMVNIQPVSVNNAPSTSVFNLSQSKQPPSQPAAPAGQTNYASKISTDPWGANEWATPEPAPPAKQMNVGSPAIQQGGGDFGWGSSNNATASQNAWTQPASTSNFGANNAGGWGTDSGFGASNPSGAFSPPKVAAEEDFGGWGSSTVTESKPKAQQSTEAPKSFGGSEDLFSNVWG